MLTFDVQITTYQPLFSQDSPKPCKSSLVGVTLREVDEKVGNVFAGHGINFSIFFVETMSSRNTLQKTYNVQNIIAINHYFLRKPTLDKKDYCV